jgi:hypothetical protein
MAAIQAPFRNVFSPYLWVPSAARRRKAAPGSLPGQVPPAGPERIHFYVNAVRV